MTGTLGATRVPYSSDSDEYDEAVDKLDEHAGSYPIRGELRVRECMLCMIHHGRCVVVFFLWVLHNSLPASSVCRRFSSENSSSTRGSESTHSALLGNTPESSAHTLLCDRRTCTHPRIYHF